MPAARVSRIKIYDNTFKNSLGRKCSKVIFITIKICRASYIINLLLFNWYFLGMEINLEYAHKTRFCYLLGVFSKFSD